MNSIHRKVYAWEESAENGEVKLKMIINYQVSCKASINSGLQELNADNSFSSSSPISYNLRSEKIQCAI